MARQQIGQHERDTALNAIKKYGNTAAAGRALGIPEATLRRWKNAAKSIDIVTPSSIPSLGTSVSSKDSITGYGNTCEITKTTNQIVKTLEDIISVCQIDTETWDIDRYVCNKWDSGDLENYQVKVWLRKKVAVVDAKEEIASLLADAKSKMPKRITIVRKLKSPSNILLEPQIPDLHAGKLAWGEETGWEDYDLKTAESVFDLAIDALIERTKSFGCDRVVLPLGNDLLHSDNKYGTTTSGTPLDTDSRYPKVFSVVRKMCVRSIDRLLEEVGEVEVKLIPGNHDNHSVWHLGDSLECWYRNSKGVSIDNQPRQRKYFQHGDVMLMWAHGNKGKLEKYPEIMAAEEPAMWGNTKYREAHTGDKHHQRVLELKGCKVRISPALCPPDAWHSEMTFVGTLRSAEAFCWHPEEGLIGSAMYTVKSNR